MKKRTLIPITFLLIVVISICLFYFVYKGQVLAPENKTVESQNGYEIKDISIGQNEITTEIANTPAKRTLGLGNRTSLPENSGMLFVFDSPGQYGFWMKDTLIPLDMVWIDQNKTIIYIKENVLPSSFPTVYSPGSNALYVLELNAGYVQNHGIKTGDKVSF